MVRIWVAENVSHHLSINLGGGFSKLLYNKGTFYKEEKIMLNITKTTIEIGLEKPLKVLHVTDNHLPLCDERDNERKRAVAARKAAITV